MAVNRPGTIARGTRPNGFDAAPVLGGDATAGGRLDGGLTLDRFAETTTVAATTAVDEPSHRDGGGDTPRGP